MMIHVLIYFINRHEPGDGGIDLFGGFREYTIIGQCKVNIVVFLHFLFLIYALK